MKDPTITPVEVDCVLVRSAFWEISVGTGDGIGVETGDGALLGIGVGTVDGAILGCENGATPGKLVSGQPYWLCWLLLFMHKFKVCVLAV